ncbi:MAG: PAS domain S-box protein [Armatimonadetes bacterium]|nr:PAS domain S-box protein [Armatimonadota bacterium]
MTDIFNNESLFAPGDDSPASLPPIDYRTFADSLPEIVWIADAQGRTTYHNRHWYEYLGVKPHGDLPLVAWEAIHPDDRERLREHWQQTVASDATEMREEFRLRGADGVYRWFLAHGYAQKDAQTGKTLRWLGSNINVDAIKQAQEQLRYSDDRYRALVDASSQVVWTNTAEGMMTGAQPGWSRLTGQTEAEYQGYGWSKAVHPGDAQPTIDAWETSVRTRSPFLFEHRVRRFDGAWRLFAIRAVPVIEGDIIREWVGIHTDITEERAAADKQVQTLAQLSAVLESALDGVLVADGAGSVLIMNPAARTMLEVPGTVSVPCPMEAIVALINLFTPDEKPITPGESPLSRGLRGETFSDFECRVQSKLGDTQWWASCSVSPVLDARGNVTLVTLILRDITERRTMETQRDALMRRVAEAADKQRRFLREILSSMSEGRLRLCENASELPEPIASLPAHESVTLDKMTIRTLRRQLAEACGQAGLPSDRESDLITAVGEAAMNAVVHAGTGIGTVYVAPERGIVQVFVQDSGTGINEESLHRATLEKGFTTAGTLGHGFWMMLKTADRVYLLTGVKGTTVVMEQERTPPVPAWMQSFVDSSY